MKKRRPAPDPKKQIERLSTTDNAPSQQTLTTDETDARSPTQWILADRPGYLIRRLQQLAVAIFMQEMAGSDLSPVQYGVLAVVNESPGIDQVTTARAVGIDRATIVGVVARLERKGLLSRTVSKRDRRARMLKTTATGKTLLEKMNEPETRICKRLLEPFATGEGQFFCEQMIRFIRYHESRIGEVQSALADAEP